MIAMQDISNPGQRDGQSTLFVIKCLHNVLGEATAISHKGVTLYVAGCSKAK
ncbi:hypothetical protein IVB15_24415 [Bradyrhizobium sp. 182]|nr:hypothetical protein [Bradyrhizobium sp. 182]